MRHADAKMAIHLNGAESTQAFVKEIGVVVGRGGGGVLRLNKPNRNVPPHRVGFLSCFGLKTGIHFTHFGLESGMVSEGATECMNVFIVSIPNK